MIIPKGLIQTTSTDELKGKVYYGSSETLYTGPCHRLSTGVLYTGPTPSLQSKRLYFLSPSGERLDSGKLYNRDAGNNTTEEQQLQKTSYVKYEKNNMEYINSIRGKKSGPKNKLHTNVIQLPNNINMMPTVPQYMYGNMLRFIVRSFRDNTFFFTNLNGYKYFKENRRETFAKVESVYHVSGLRWFIRGNTKQEVVDINAYNVERLNTLKSMNGVIDFIQNYDEFYVERNTHLYTVGQELLFENGSEYRGYYNYNIDSTATPQIFEGKTRTADSRPLSLKNKSINPEEALYSLGAVSSVERVSDITTFNGTEQQLINANVRNFSTFTSVTQNNISNNSRPSVGY